MISYTSVPSISLFGMFKVDFHKIQIKFITFLILKVLYPLKGKIKTKKK